VPCVRKIVAKNVCYMDFVIIALFQVVVRRCSANVGRGVMIFGMIFLIFLFFEFVKIERFNFYKLLCVRCCLQKLR